MSNFVYDFCMFDQNLTKDSSYRLTITGIEAKVFDTRKITMEQKTNIIFFAFKTIARNLWLYNIFTRCYPFLLIKLKKWINNLGTFALLAVINKAFHNIINSFNVWQDDLITASLTFYNHRNTSLLLTDMGTSQRTQTQI